jgi:hypothetical protein
VVEAAQRANVPVTLNARPDLLHVWPILVPVLPEARQDLRRIAGFIRSTGRRDAAPTARAGVEHDALLGTADVADAARGELRGA